MITAFAYQPTMITNRFAANVATAG